MSTDSSKVPGRGFEFDPWLVALMAAGLLLRFGFALLLDQRMHFLGDERDYLRFAAMFRETGVLETGMLVRPPLYFTMIAGLGILLDPLGMDVRIGVKLVQCLVGVATAVPVYLTANRVGGLRVARLAVAFLMFDPTLIAYTHMIWPEIILLFILAIIFHNIDALDEGSRTRIALVGILIGMAMLMKPAVGLFSAVLAGHWLWRLEFRKAVRLMVLVGGIAAVVISPWVVRNLSRYGPEILVVNQVPYNLWIGNGVEHPRQIHSWWREMDPLEQSRVGMSRGIASITSDPGRFARNYAVRALNLWGFEFHVIRHVTYRGYGRLDKDTRLKIFWLVQTAWIFTLIFAAFGTRFSLRDPIMRLLFVYAIVFTVVVSAMVTTTRFRIPLMFPLVIASAMGVDQLLAGRWRRADVVAAAAAAGLLLLSFSRPVFQAISSNQFRDVEPAVRAAWRLFRY